LLLRSPWFSFEMRNNMKFRCFTHAVYGLAAGCLLIMCGCATSVVRSNSSVNTRHVFPATALDAEFFWKSGIKGETLFAATDPNDRNSGGVRFAYGLGTIIDTPFSIMVDTLLLPVDLARSKPAEAHTSAQCQANRSLQ